MPLKRLFDMSCRRPKLDSNNAAYGGYRKLVEHFKDVGAESYSRSTVGVVCPDVRATGYIFVQIRLIPGA